VIVLDDHWRLQAMDAGSSAHARLTADLDALLADLPRGDHCSLILAGPRPQLLAGPAAHPDEARAALARWQPDGLPGDRDGALTLALALAADGDGRHAVLLAGDEEPPSASSAVGLLLHGHPVANAGLVDVRRLAAETQRPDRLAIQLLATTDSERTLVLRSATGELERQRVALRAGQRRLLEMTLPAQAGSVVVELEPGDALARDDRVAVPPLPSRPVGVWLDPTLPAAARSVLLRAFRAAGAASAVDANGAAILVQGGSVPAAPGAWLLRVAPGGGTLRTGPFLAEREHPLLADLDGTGCLWTGGLPSASAAADAKALLLADGLVLLAEAGTARQRRYDLHARLSDAGSGLAQHPFLPGLVANLVATRRAALPGSERNLLSGPAPWRVQLPEDGAELRLRDPDGQETRLAADNSGAVILPALERAGTWSLADGQGRDLGAVTMLHLDSRLSNTTHCTAIRRPAPWYDAGGAGAGGRGPLAHVLPLLVAGLAALAAWAAYARRGD
jgi:hypothetical protein